MHLSASRDAGAARVRLATAVTLTVLAAGIHAYLCAMVFLLSLALGVRFLVEDIIPLHLFAVFLAVLSLVCLGVFVLFGYIGAGFASNAPGFGVLSADLLTLVNSMGESTVLPALPAGKWQLEGAAYLGLGVLLLGIAVATALARRRSLLSPLRKPALWPLLVSVGLMSVYALSSVITFAGNKLVDLQLFYRPLEPVVGTLRASGRFIWPFHYLVTGAVIAGVVALYRGSERKASVMLAAALVVQLFDFGGALRRSPYVDQLPRFTAPAWSDVGTDYKHLALYPPFLSGQNIKGTLSVCGGEKPEGLPWLALHAYHLGLTFNSAWFSRIDTRRAETYCADLATQLTRGEFESDTIYVVLPGGEAPFRVHAQEVVCGVLDALPVCVKRSTRTAFAVDLLHNQH